MNAFLVLLALIAGPQGPMVVTIKLPWTSVEHCQKYLADPTPIDSNWGVIRVLKVSASCEAKVERGS